MSTKVHPENEKVEPVLQTASDICIPEDAASIYDLGGHVKVTIILLHVDSVWRICPNEQYSNQWLLNNWGLFIQVDFAEIFSAPEAYEDNALGRTIGHKVINIGFNYLFTYVQVSW